MKTSFSKRIFLSLFASAAVSAGTELIVELFDGIIAGLMIGETALTAIALIAPTYLFNLFVSGLIVKGSSYEYSRALGLFDRKRADEITGQCLIVCVSVGILLFTAAVVCKDAFFDYLQVSSSVRAEAEAYFRIYKFMYLLMPIEYYVEAMVQSDGDSTVNFIASVTGGIVHIVLPVVLIKQYGVVAVALGSVVGILSIILVYCTHFFRKNNNIRFRWHFSIKDIKHIVPLSLADAIYLLCGSLISVILNKFVITVYSEKYIPILTAAMAVFQLTLFFQAIGNAIKPIGEIYRGENNMSVEKELYRYAVKVSVIVSIILSAAVVIFASVVLKIYGISDPELIGIGITSIRRMACSLPFLALSFILSSQNLIIRNTLPAVLFVFGGLFALPVLGALALGSFLPYNSIFIGFAIGALAAAVLAYYADRKLAKKRGAEDTAPLKTINQSYYINEHTLVDIRNNIEQGLLSIECSKSEIVKMLLLVEEYILNVIQRNPGKVLFGESSIILDKDCAYIYLRDNGEIFDWSDPDNRIMELSTYVLNNLLETFKSKRYVSALCYNRVVLKIKINA